MDNNEGLKVTSPNEQAALATIRREEASRINERRKCGKYARGSIDEAGEPDGDSSPLTGLALSGGGVRSASVCLGAVQALHDAVGIEGVDYLSTVSGGGYLGCCLTAGLHLCEGRFPFSDGAYGDTDPVRHIRDFSKYLVPNGWPDYLTAAAIFLRGLLANAILLAPLLLSAAWLTLSIYPNWQSLSHQRFLWWDLADVAPAWAIGGITPLWSTSCFAVTQNLLLIGIAILTLWVFGKSVATSSGWRFIKELKVWEELRDTNAWNAARALLRKSTFGQWDIGTLEDYRNAADNSAELVGFFPSLMRVLFIVTAITAFFELQPFILQQLSKSETAPPSSIGGWDNALQLITQWLAIVTPMLAPVGAALAFLSKFLLKIEVLASHSSKLWVRVLSLSTKIAWFFIGLIIPSFIWYVYLSLVEAGLHHANSFDGESHVSKLLGERLGGILADVHERLGQSFLTLFFPTAETVFYFGLLLVFLVGALLVNPNGTSFFRLYRDRLNKAFVFDPVKRDRRNDLRAAAIKLHEIKTVNCPYPIVNATLNLEGSQFANKRGRNADFFMFSPLYVGSLATNYVGSKTMWIEERDLDLGTAMAISGAAISPNMGSSTLRPLVATLALLNVRLGYWMRNPRWVGGKSASDLILSDIWSGALRSVLLFWREVFSRIDETSPDIYLTDGGNLENLGLYELLRRRCKVIIVIDAEADPEMEFSSFVALQRYARTDLGVVIDLPWEKIRVCALATRDAFEAAIQDPTKVVEKKQGPHCAVGKILYSRDPGEDGLLFYFKSSMTGDENDVIFDYKRRHSDFPHETTIDQFFGEEQLEAYRALGFHMVHEILDPGRVGDPPNFAIVADPGNEAAARAEALETLRKAMRGKSLVRPVGLLAG